MDGTRSSSTSRLRLTYAYLLVLVIVTAIAGRPPLPRLVDHALACIAIVLVVGASLGRIWTSVFIAGRKDQELVTQGPYALCRHPLYALSLVGGLGLGLATRSLTLTLLTLCVLGALYSRAARDEGRRLSCAHGRSYVDYAATTPAWLPSFRRWPLPATLSINAAVLWKAFLDAGSFVVLYLALETARLLREAGVFPTLIPLP